MKNKFLKSVSNDGILSAYISGNIITILMALSAINTVVTCDLGLIFNGLIFPLIVIPIVLNICLNHYVYNIYKMKCFYEEK